jgi:tRNA A-37 threonylcarbamoyl transferase component Bud32
VDHPLTEDRRRVALVLLERALGERPTIIGEEPLGHAWAPVTRLVLDRVLPDGGNSVIVKTRRVEGAGHGGPAHLRREHTGLRLAAPASVAPRVIGFDDAAGVIAVTDLGRWPTVEAVLLGSDGGAAIRAMVELGRAVGRLHATTLLVTQPRSCPAVACDAPIDSLGDWSSIEAICDEHGFPDARVARDDIAALHARLVAPGPFAGLVHGDLNPTNAVVTPDGVKLVDFEGATRGHLGLDIAFLHYPFPTYSAHWATLPDEVVRDADAAYRETLAPVVPRGALTSYDDMLAVGAAAMLVLRVQRLDKLVSPGQPPHERWRRRAQLVQQIRVLEQLAARPLPVLVDWLTRLARAMSDRWIDATTPPPAVFPAFRADRERREVR